MSILFEIFEALSILLPHRVQKVDSSGISLPHFEQNTTKNLSDGG
jgi:hypothetical protein